MCNHSSAEAFSSIDPNTGVLTLAAVEASDFANYSSKYLVEIKGTVGNKDASNVFQVELRKPCTYPLVIIEPDPFEEEIPVYIMGPATEITLTPPMATQDINANCGVQKIAFFNDDNDGAIDPQIASYDDNSFVFSILPQTDISKIGKYNMYFTVTLLDHGTTVKSQTFAIKVYSRCESPFSLSPP